ncbi:MAG: hypothetical protein RRC07_00470 [Anaerolineae bacterium]|nr:hypothetical protein [Anaerolineae bacterium]
MEIGSAIIAGLVGTAVMTALMYLGPRMGMPEMDMIGMLGTMVTADEGLAKPIGAVIHFMMGAIFAIIYAFVWANLFGAPTWLWGLVFGAIHGVIAIVTMPMMIRMHPRPPAMQMGPQMMMGILMGHLVFGLVVALVYGALV